MPEHFAHLRAYMDANILISATYSELSRFWDFWRMKNVHPVASAYTVGEARRNLLPFQHGRFEQLLAQTELHADPEVCALPAGIQLVEKDRPILAAAIHAHADYLVTGDKHHFKHLYGETISGVCVISPADFLNTNSYRLPGERFA